LEFETLTEAVEALCIMNHYPIRSAGIKFPFIMKLCFSSSRHALGHDEKWDWSLRISSLVSNIAINNHYQVQKSILELFWNFSSSCLMLARVYKVIAEQPKLENTLATPSTVLSAFPNPKGISSSSTMKNKKLSFFYRKKLIAIYFCFDGSCEFYPYRYTFVLSKWSLLCSIIVWKWTRNVHIIVLINSL